MEEDLDISWILEQERLENIDKNSWREALSEIGITTIYLNKNKEIETIERETMDVSGITILKREKLIQMIESKKKYTPTSKYIMKEILWFHVDLEPESISSFSEKEHSFLHIYPILEDIILKPSIFIFHKLNTLYFFFHETFLPNACIPNPIIKPDYKHNKTKKKVEIIESKQSEPKHIKTTRKKIT